MPPTHITGEQAHIPTVSFERTIHTSSGEDLHYMVGPYDHSAASAVLPGFNMSEKRFMNLSGRRGEKMARAIGRALEAQNRDDQMVHRAEFEAENPDLI